MAAERDHGGGVDAAARRFGGMRSDWLDLSTGINPCPYPVDQIPPEAWTALPDTAAQTTLTDAARRFWSVPQTAAVLAAPGASALIARIPRLGRPGRAHIPTPTYNEHAGAFVQEGWELSETDPNARVVVHPNNPDGRYWRPADLDGAALRIVDESFCDICPDRSLIAEAARPGTIVLKSFGKFWGLAGLRLGFAIGDPALIDRLARMLGPWPVSGPALHIGRLALEDTPWATDTRARLAGDAARLDRLMQDHGKIIGGTPLFRLYEVDDAARFQDRLARQRIWIRIFPYSRRWVRLGLPGSQADWTRLETAL
ncbi:threonine-phosphate decarboxylase CobD [Fluviibacterium sp. DFM31]|uniref:threonine-phosphate decarboxylase n=1 Tax=Meridianimarinicoccus marinus TaxID=3231483 RepID=A0ABV3L754_9RHOB